MVRSGAEAVGTGVGTKPANRVKDGFGDDDTGKPLLGLGDPTTLLTVGFGPSRLEIVGIGLERQAAAHDLDSERRIGHRVDIDGQAEAVEQLGPEVAFLGIHRPDQHEPRRMAERQALALDVVDPHRGGVEQQVDEVVAQQVNLVDVKDAPVRRGEQARLEGPSARC